MSRSSVTRQKKHIVTKDVVGLLLGEVNTKKNIVEKDVVGLLLGEVVGDCQNSAKRFSRHLGVAKRWLDPGLLRNELNSRRHVRTCRLDFRRA